MKLSAIATLLSQTLIIIFSLNTGNTTGMQMRDWNKGVCVLLRIGVRNVCPQHRTEIKLYKIFLCLLIRKNGSQVAPILKKSSPFAIFIKT